MQLTIASGIEGSSSSSSSTENPTLQTSVNANGRTVHLIRDPQICAVLVKFLTCPFTQVGTVETQGTLIHPSKILLSRHSHKQQFSTAMFEKLRELFGNEKFCANTIEELDRLLVLWHEVEDKLFCPTSTFKDFFFRWGFKALFGFSIDLENLKTILDEIETGALNEKERQVKLTEIKSILRQNINIQQQVPETLFYQLTQRGFEVGDLIDHCFEQLLVIQKFGTAQMNYLLWVLANDSALQNYMREVADQAEEIFQETSDVTNYLKALQTLDDFITHSHPNTWTTTLKSNIMGSMTLKKGDEIHCAIDVELESDELPAFTHQIGTKKHQCEKSESFRSFLKVLLSKILNNYYLASKQKEMTFELKSFFEPIEPIQLLLTPTRFPDASSSSSSDSDD